MLPDSSAIANALIAKLGADADLLALVPNGVYEDLGPPNAKRFVVVSQILATDTPVLSQGRVIEDALYLIEARVLASTAGVGVAAAAAARIDALLEDGTLTVPGYQVSAMCREEFVRGTEVDEVDPSIVWKRRGGRYRVTAYREIVASAVAAESLYPTTPDRFGLLDFAIWFDGPLKVPDPAGVSIDLVSSDPARLPDVGVGMDAARSLYNVTDPGAPGRAMVRFRSAQDMSTWSGLTLTLSDASTRHNWSKLLNRESGEPVADTLGDVVLTIPLLP
jgi:hypothetical protein